MSRAKYWQATNPIAIVKPGRTAGAVWTSDLAARRRAVMMCESCFRKYWGWWAKEHYKPDWGWWWTSDCDGCSTGPIRCAIFLPEENFDKVLTKAHGRQTQPYS